MNKLISVEAAAGMIRDGDMLAFNAMGWLGNPEIFYKALEKRYLNEGRPNGITLYCACGIGGRELPELANRLAHKGLVSCLIGGHLDSMRSFFPLINTGDMKAYNLSQGMLSHNLHEAARRSPGFYTSIGLHTLLDPRVEGPGLNKESDDELIRVENIDGKEQLFIKTIYPDVCVIRGTTADVNGNITFEKEALLLDPLTMAQAVKNNGGRVIVQVERISDSHANPQHVRIPCQFVDAIYLNPDQMQTASERYNALYSGEYNTPWEQVSEYMKTLQKKGAELSVKRLEADRIIARRAALEIRSGDMINLGIGIPTSIGLELNDLGITTPYDFTFSVELGMVGGVPAGETAFGAVINADSIYDQNSQFEYYEGGGLDISFVGALEFDVNGNINVSRKGNKIFGLGGFNYVSQTPKRLVVCSKYMAGSGCRREHNEWILTDGKVPKLVEAVDHISFNGKQASLKGQEVLFVTERAVFVLEEDGLVITEIAPYVDLKKDVLDHLDFEVRVSEELKLMPAKCFDFN